MTVTRDQILDELKRLTLPDGGNLVSRDMVRALSVDGPQVRFVIEAPDPATARKMEAIRNKESVADQSKRKVLLRLWQDYWDELPAKVRREVEGGERYGNEMKRG